MLGLKKIPEIETLNLMYKHLPPKSTRKLENFNGERRITVYRGKDYMNKTIQKLDSGLMLVRTLANVGTKDKPQLVTKAVMLRAPKADVFVYLDQWGNPQKGIHVDVNRRDGFEPYQKKYDSFMHMRQDKFLMYLLEKFTGKKLL